MGWLRLAFLMYVGLTIIYFLTSIYSRSVRREKLEKEWDTDPAREDTPKAERTAFIEDGMQAYDKGLKKRLLWLIYILPTIAFAAVIYFINWH
jgi:hypothetical protein